MSWVEVSNLERKIILAVHKNSKSLTELAKELDRNKSTISITVKRLIKQDIMEKSQEYVKDARKIEISINSKRVRIEKSHKFYLNYYVLITSSLGISGVISFFLKNFFFILGSIVIALPLFLLLLYQVYVMVDKVIVEKNPKMIKKESKSEPVKESEIS